MIVFLSFVILGLAIVAGLLDRSRRANVLDFGPLKSVLDRPWVEGTPPQDILTIVGSAMFWKQYDLDAARGKIADLEAECKHWAEQAAQVPADYIKTLAFKDGDCLFFDPHRVDPSIFNDDTWPPDSPRVTAIAIDPGAVQIGPPQALCTRKASCKCKDRKAAGTEQVEKQDAPAKCDVPPPGWQCSRAPGHEGPCAATPEPPKEQA